MNHLEIFNFDTKDRVTFVVEKEEDKVELVAIIGQLSADAKANEFVKQKVLSFFFQITKNLPQII